MSLRVIDVTGKLACGSQRRFNCQFSLRALLLITALVAGGAAWLGAKIDRCRQMQSVVDKIRQCGGTVQYDYEFDENGEWINAGCRPPPGPAWLRAIVGDCLFSEPVSVAFEPHARVEEGLDHARALPSLRSLTVFSPRTDAVLSKISHCGALEELWIVGWLRGARLECLNALPRLRVLHVHLEAAADEDLLPLCGVRTPVVLYIEGGTITDVGARYLREVPCLRELSTGRAYVHGLTVPLSPEK